MKKAFQIIWPILLPIAMFIPYMFLNQYVIVKWLGCSCPRFSEDGTAVYSSFNANDFTALFWAIIALISIIGSFFSLKHFPQKNIGGFYILIVIFLSTLLAYQFTASMVWK